MQAIDEREIAKTVAHGQRSKNDLYATDHSDRETARGLVKRKLTELRLREQHKAGIQKTIAAIDAEIAHRRRSRQRCRTDPKEVASARAGHYHRELPMVLSLFLKTSGAQPAMILKN